MAIYYEDDFDIVEDTYESYAMRIPGPVHMTQQMTTKVFLAFDDCNITELEPEKRGPEKQTGRWCSSVRTFAG